MNPVLLPLWAAELFFFLRSPRGARHRHVGWIVVVLFAAIELLGRGRNLPPVYAVQNTYHLWGPPPDPVDAAITLAPFPEDAVRRLFADVEVVGAYRCEWCMAWRAGATIWIGRGPRSTFREAWPYMKHFE